jgi:two-component system, LytTR family, sensor kinase
VSGVCWTHVRDDLAIVMTGQILLGPYLAASLIGFAAGTVISALLLVLTSRASRLPGTPAANILFAVCSLLWNLSGFAHAIAITLGTADGARVAQALLASQFTAAAAWPVALLAIWSPLAARSGRQRIGFKVLQTLSVVNFAVLAILLWSGILSSTHRQVPMMLKDATAYNGTILLALGMALFRDRLASRAMRLPSIAILIGVLGASLSVVLSQAFPYYPALCTGFGIIAEQITLLIVLGAFFLFTRFRFSDVFIRNSIRVLTAAMTAIVFLVLASVPFLAQIEREAAFPNVVRVLIETLLLAALLFAFTFVDRHIEVYVDRWIFGAPDYRSLIRQMSDRLSRVHSESGIAAVAKFAGDALELKDAQFIALETLPDLQWPDALLEGDVVELDDPGPLRERLYLPDLELLIPVHSAGGVSHLLAIAPGSARRGMVTHEVNFLRSAAAQFGQRLDALRLEAQMVEQQSREAVLLQQVTEAELRALRAQINPHFLFNSLNSIANLIVANPDQAETMTLRLARVFRHVLANSSRPLIPLHEEIEFLRTYLQIEGARFGNRLAVNIEVDPGLDMERIPTLILQPIVENALKHGLGPKPGQGHLWIAAEICGNQMRLRVEDDGVGSVFAPRQSSNGRSFAESDNGHNGKSNGVGLENIAQRLNALYQDQGEMILEAREAGGTRVTILLPREAGAVTV